MAEITLSDFIRANIESILQEWEKFAKDIFSARKMDKTALRDHASGMLLTIAADLDCLQTPHEQAEKAEGRAPQNTRESQAERHGAARLLSGFSVSEEVSEFRALRASVLRLWTASDATAAQTTSDDLIRFNEAIDQALVESIARYSFDAAQYVRLFDTLLSSSPDLSYLLDLEGNFIYANKSFKSLLGTALGNVVGQHLQDLGHASAFQLQQQLQQVIDTQETSHAEISLMSLAGTEVIYENLFVPVTNKEGHLEAVAGTARDVTVRKKKENEAQRSANYDGLTGLPNRNFFRDKLEWEVNRSQRTKLPIALLFIDLDGFKEVNDELGHDAGDQLLHQVAQRLGTCVRVTDTVARLGGDEFTVILADVNKIAHIEILAQEMLVELARPFPLPQKEVQISGSIGIALYPQDAATAENLVKNADQAMYVAKNAGRNRFSFFTADMRDSAWAHLKVIDELRKALPEQQLSVYYQPIVELSGGRIVKAEALLRWHHPQTGVMLPAAFIGLAEEIGLIGDIDDWVLGEAMHCAREWSALVGSPFQISVNKSPLEFLGNALTRNWDAHLEALGLAWNSISVEISEGVLLQDSPRVTERLKNLQKAGVQLSVDDFGSRYSSMTYLKKFDVEYLKIDQSFVHDAPTSRDSRVIVEALIAMAHKLGLRVIAEGVETGEQGDWLKAAGCDYAQGYHFSEALPVHDFEKLLNTRKTLYH